jgi:hypothetical protein
MKPMSLSETLDKIFEYPSIYIGRKSVDRAFTFICGYSVALQQTEIDWKDNLEEGFSSWVCGKFDYLSTHTWASVCIFHSLDEGEAFELAKKLWIEYKSEMMNN